jgi:hypothetical protein
MTIRTARSHSPDVRAAARDIKQGIGGVDPRFVLFFVSSHYDPQALGEALERELGGIPAIGCTTAGELQGADMLAGSVVALGMDGDVIDAAHVAVIGDLNDPDAVPGALASLAAAAGGPLTGLDPATHVGLVLHDGLSGAEEQIMDRITDLSNVPFIGGSAGDDTKFERTHVFAGFRPRSGASVLALLRTRRPFHILKTQSFDVLDRVLTVTEVDEATRTVHGFDGQPAAEEYARAIGVAKAELPGCFQRNPLGLVVPGGEPFVRSPQQVKGDSVVFYCQVKEGMELHVLQARNIVDDTRRDLEAKLREMGECQGLVNFHCILRTLELQQKGLSEAYGSLFGSLPSVGFSTYGESYIGHINQTSTMLLFG